MNRREVLIGGACVAAAVAVPALLHASKARGRTAVGRDRKSVV